MQEPHEQNPFDELYSSEIRHRVSAGNQLYLPADLLNEIGFTVENSLIESSPSVAWYYHEPDEKAVLSDKSVNQSTLEFVGRTSMSGVDKEDWEDGLTEGARITVLSALPEHLHNLRTPGPVVLKPVYEGEEPELESTCVSVYPAAEYDNGELPNVSLESATLDGEELGTDEDGRVTVNYPSHANSIGDTL